MLDLKHLYPLPAVTFQRLVAGSITKTEHIFFMKASPISTADDTHITQLHPYPKQSQEHVLSALALLLGPETSQTIRLRATRHLARQGSSVLPLVLTTLHTYPEIISPPWPHWPVQYEHCSRLLLHLCRCAGLSLEALLQHPIISQPVGPVLWTSIIEAANLQPSTVYEPLLYQGLTAPWHSTRYAAAMALAHLTDQVALQPTTLELLHTCLQEQEPLPLRLTASYALLRSNDSSGLAVLMQLIAANIPCETRKAAIFVLATDPPLHLCSTQRSKLIQLLLTTLQDDDGEIALHAAHILSRVASPATLPALYTVLASSRPQAQIATLTALEEMADRKTMHRAIHQHNLPSTIVPLLRTDVAEVRRQAACTLAAIGGKYASAVLGTTLFNKEHPAQLAAIEGLRYLRGARSAPHRTRVVSWLLYTLRQSSEQIQVATLDSLAHLTLQARINGYEKAYEEISQTIYQDSIAIQLLTSPSAWVRQRTVELLSMLAHQPQTLHTQFLHLLHTDNDSGVRACVAYVLDTLQANWAIPDLLHALLDPDEYVAETALNALAHLASPDHAIVAYILKELAQEHHKEQPSLRLSQAARHLLKKWRKGNGKSTQPLSLLL